MYWLKLAGFLLPFLAYGSLVYGAIVPLEPEARLFMGTLGFLFGGVTASSIHELESWFAEVGTTHGSARFATVGQLFGAGLFGKTGVLLGRHLGGLLRLDQPGHLLTLAPTRAGKGTCAVIPNLLEYPGSIVTVDIKGENHAIAGRRRRDFGKVIKFAPFEADSHRFNPLDFIRAGEHAWDDAAMLADMIIVPSGSEKSVFYESEARAFLTALILYVATEAPDPHRNLTTVRLLSMLGGEAMSLHLRNMQQARHAVARRTATAFTQKEAKLQSYILAEIQSQTQIWDSARVPRVTARSDFSMDDLKTGTMSLFIIIPPEHLNVYRPLVRLMLGLAVGAMTRQPVRPEHPVLFLADEFPALGRMKPIQDGIAYLAGYGCKLWLFAQDLGQLESIYGEKGTRSLIANSSIQAFGNSDNETLELLSKMLGTATVRTQGKSQARHSLVLPDYDHFSTSSGEAGRPLMTPDEIRCLGPDKQLLFIKGLRPILARKEPYYRVWRYRGLWDRWDR